MDSRAIFFGCIAAILLVAIPANAQQTSVKRVFVHVTNAVDGTSVPGSQVIFVKPGEKGNAQSTGGFFDLEAETTDNGGTAVFQGQFTPGIWEIQSFRSALHGLFESTTSVVYISNEQTEYHFALPLKPTPRRSWARRDVPTDNLPRNLLIRVQGRMPDGSLVPVHNALVYNRAGQYLTTTDYEGLAVVQHNLALGESYEVRAQVPPRGYQRRLWAPGTGSFIVGASEGGTRFTRSDDYVNIILAHESSITLENSTHEIYVRVQGRMPDGTLVPVHYATIYGEDDKKIVMTGYDGTGKGLVQDVPIGDTYHLRAEANHWKNGFQTVTMGERENSPVTAASDYANFVLEPLATAPLPEVTLTVRVVDYASDAPIAGAVVTLYKRVGYPGDVVAHASTDSNGFATFPAGAVAASRAAGEPRLGAGADNYQGSVQDVSAEIFSRREANYLMFLKRNEGIDPAWSGSFFSPRAGGGDTLTLFAASGTLHGQIQGSYPDERATGAYSIGRCTVTGSVADCAYSGTYASQDETVTMSGKMRLSLAGANLSLYGQIIQSHQSCPGQCAYTTKLQPGFSATTYYTRISR